MENQQRRSKEENERLQQKMAANAKGEEQRLKNMIMACIREVEEDRTVLMRDNQVMKERLEEMERCNQQMKRRISDMNHSLEDIQTKLRELNEPGFLERAQRIVSGVETVARTVNTISSACIVM